MFVPPDNAPDWLSRLARAIDRAMTVEIADCPLGFAWLPEPKNGCQHVFAFPSSGEVLYGPEDGKPFFPGYSVCVSALAAAFDAPPHIDWLAPSIWRNDFEGVQLVVIGSFEGQPVALSLLEQAPGRFAPTMRYNTRSRRFEPKPVRTKPAP